MKINKKMQVLLCAAILCGALPIASAADDVVYGTMQIPYSEFYSSEGLTTDVDAVSSATTSKWKNENLTAGTYNSENENGGGTIHGVVYPVAISSSELESLGDNNYGFTKLDSVPEAYKQVTVNDGKVTFSEVKGATSAVEGVTASITSDTKYGDYCIEATVNNQNGTSDVGRIYGVILETSNGDTYGMRHLENIWRDQIAWSSGFVTKESHGNTLSYENYASMAGQTITKITYITDSGYHTLSTELYVPQKFENTFEVSNADVSVGKTNVKISGFPSDYKSSYSVNGLDMAVSGNSLTYKNAVPGSYTLIVSDTSGKYADVKASFTLTTDNMPATISNSGIVKAEGASDSEFANFLGNISKVTVGETSYSASGKRAVKIIGENGVIDLSIKSGDNNVFAEDGEYDMSVISTGYNLALNFKLSVKDQKIVSVSAEKSIVSETTSQSTVDLAPKTADSLGMLIAAAVASGAVALGYNFRKKED